MARGPLLNYAAMDVAPSAASEGHASRGIRMLGEVPAALARRGTVEVKVVAWERLVVGARGAEVFLMSESVCLSLKEIRRAESEWHYRSLCASLGRIHGSADLAQPSVPHESRENLRRWRRTGLTQPHTLAPRNTSGSDFTRDH